MSERSDRIRLFLLFGAVAAFLLLVGGGSLFLAGDQDESPPGPVAGEAQQPTPFEPPVPDEAPIPDEAPAPDEAPTAPPPSGPSRDPFEPLVQPADPAAAPAPAAPVPGAPPGAPPAPAPAPEAPPPEAPPPEAPPPEAPPPEAPLPEAPPEENVPGKEAVPGGKEAVPGKDSPPGGEPPGRPAGGSPQAGSSAGPSSKKSVVRLRVLGATTTGRVHVRADGKRRTLADGDRFKHIRVLDVRSTGCARFRAANEFVLCGGKTKNVHTSST